MTEKFAEPFEGEVVLSESFEDDSAGTTGEQFGCFIKQLGMGVVKAALAGLDE